MHRPIKTSTMLSNIKIHKLPPDTTAILQPMDQGVIAQLKNEFQNLKTNAAVEHFLETDSAPPRVSLLQGIEWCTKSWCRLDPRVVAACWRHAGLQVDRLSLQCLLNGEI